MWLDYLSDPVIVLAITVFIAVVIYYSWREHKEKERYLEERLRKLEEQQQKADKNKS